MPIKTDIGLAEKEYFSFCLELKKHIFYELAYDEDYPEVHCTYDEEDDVFQDLWEPILESTVRALIHGANQTDIEELLLSFFDSYL